MLEGNADGLELVDTTLDGGVGLRHGRAFSGRRAVAESIPSIIRWTSKRRFLDYETSIVKTVSERLRTLIEEIEPGVHQFQNVEYVSKDGNSLGSRSFWQICNRIDSIHRTEGNWTFNGVNREPPPKSLGPPRLVFDIEKTGTAEFWHDKHDSAETIMSDHA